MLSLPETEDQVVCETAYHDQARPVEEWPEWQQEFYKEYPPSVYRIPHNKDGFVPLFFVTDIGRQEYNVLSVGQAILKHMVMHGWFPLRIFDSVALQNMCELAMDNTVTALELFRLVQTTHCFKQRLNNMMDMLVNKSQELDTHGLSNLKLAVEDGVVYTTEHLFDHFGLYVDQDIFVMDSSGLIATTSKTVLHHSSIEFRIRQLLSNWFCAWPYYQHLETCPVFHHQHYQTRHVQVINQATSI
jgi:hypothetical protein